MNTRTSTYAFTPGKDSLAEYHVLISVTAPSLRFENQLEAVLQAATEAATGRTVHFRRFFLSDAANQAPLLRQALATLPPVATSVIGQAPLDGTRIALWMYCTAPMEDSADIPTHNGYAHHWNASLVSAENGSCRQMSALFEDLDGRLGRKGLSVADHVLRTWIFVRDIDVNYAGVVQGRKEYFNRIGLTTATHFIASTGIEGQAPDSRNLVSLDAYGVSGLLAAQIRYLHAPDNLNPTIDYGVTFERGTAVTYGDRRHVFISGTASIDAGGNVLFPGDATAQTLRTLDNIDALLSDAGAGLGDIAQAIVYLRDPADYARVRPIVAKAFPVERALFVHAPVCRPSWLVEIECIALTRDGDKAFPDF